MPLSGCRDYGLDGDRSPQRFSAPTQPSGIPHGAIRVAIRREPTCPACGIQASTRLPLVRCGFITTHLSLRIENTVDLFAGLLAGCSYQLCPTRMKPLAI